MIDIIDTSSMSGRSVVAACLPVFRSQGAGVASAFQGGNERAFGAGQPAMAPATAVAREGFYAFERAVAGAAEGHQKTQLKMWALRGHDPWSYPA